MKLLSSLLAVALSASAQTAGTPIVIKGEGCPLIASLQFSPDGRELARGCAFGPFQLFDTATYDKSRTFRSEIDYTPSLTGFAYSPDGKTMATARGRGGALIWQTDDPGKPAQLDKPLKPFFGVDEVYALDKPVHVLVPPIPSSDQFASVLSVDYSPDGKLIFTKHQNGHIKIWNASTWTLQSELTVSEKGNSALFTALAIAPDSKSFVIGGQNGVLYLWNLDSKAEIRSISSPGVPLPIVQLVFSPDGKTLVAIYRGKTPFDSVAVLWNTADWTPESKAGYGAAAFSSDGRLLALGGRDIKLLDPQSRKELRTLKAPKIMTGEVLPGAPDADQEMPYPIAALALSPDGATLAVGCPGSVRVLALKP
jgi:WD40 repeat protein